VGIFFQQEADGSVYVKTIVSGGSAERDGVVRVGDMILAVDDREVHRVTREGWRVCVSCQTLVLCWMLL
jgi:C-terminal processing protease CtpA/Prc